MIESIHVALTTFFLAAVVSAFVAVVIHMMGFLIRKFSPEVKVAEKPIVAVNQQPVAVSVATDSEIVAAIMAVKKFAKK